MSTYSNSPLSKKNLENVSLDEVDDLLIDNLIEDLDTTLDGVIVSSSNVKSYMCSSTEMTCEV